VRPLPLILTLALLGCGAKADTLAYTVTSGVGRFFYDFTLVNTGATGGTIYDLFIQVPLDISLIDTSSIGTPIGWGDPTGGLLFFGPATNPSTSFIEWTSDASGLYDVTNGGSLSGFSFVSSQEINGALLFALNGSLSTIPATLSTSVPEPRDIAAYAFAVVGLQLIWMRSRRKPTRTIGRRRVGKEK